MKINLEFLQEFSQVIFEASLWSNVLSDLRKTCLILEIVHSKKWQLSKNLSVGYLVTALLLVFVTCYISIFLI